MLCVYVCVCMDNTCIPRACVLCLLGAGGRRRGRGGGRGKKKKEISRKRTSAGMKKYGDYGPFFLFFFLLSSRCRVTLGHLHALDIHLCLEHFEMHPCGNDARGDRFLAHRVLIALPADRPSSGARWSTWYTSARRAIGGQRRPASRRLAVSRYLYNID